MPVSLLSQNNNKIKISLSNKLFGIREGIAHPQTNHIFQDSFGYIWIACSGYVSRFDGKEFKNFSKEDNPDIQFFVNYINQYDDIVYAVSGKRIILFHPDMQMETLEIPDDSYIRQSYMVSPYIIIRIENLLYIFNCTNSDNPEDELLHYYCLDMKTGTFKQSRYKIPLIGAALHNEGEIFAFSVYGNKVFRLENDSYSVIQELKSSNDHSIFYMTNEKILMEETIEDKSNIYLLSLQNDTIRQELLIGQTENMMVISEIGDDEFLLQCKNSNNKFFLKNGNKQEFSFNETVYHTLKDCDGNLWLSTDKGIYNFFKRRFTNYILPESNIWDVRKDIYGNIWLSCYGSGVWRVDAEGVVSKAVYISKNTGLKTERDDAFGLSGGCEDPNKRIYLNNSNKGLVVFDPKNGNNNQLTAINSYSSTSSYYDSLTNNVYAGVHNYANVSMIAVDSNLNISKLSDVSHTIFSICRDADNILRIGTVGENLYLDEAQGLVLHDTITRPYKSIFTMAIDSSGILWKGTETGLYAEYRDGRDTLICVENINCVAFVANYKEKYLIFGYLGLKILDLEKFHKENIIDIRSFSSPQGLEISGITIGGYSIDNEGYVWLAGSEEVAVRFHPKQLMATPKMESTPKAPYLAAVYSKKKDDPDWRQSDKRSEITLENEDNSLRFDI